MSRAKAWPFLLPMMVLVGTACRKPLPTLEAPRQGLQVRVALENQGDEAAQRIWREALCDRLSNQVRLIPEGEATPNAAILDIRVETTGRANAVGRAASATAGKAFEAGYESVNSEQERDILKQLSGFVMGLGTGALCALVVAPFGAVGAQTQALYHQARLGYKPRHVFLVVEHRTHETAKPTLVMKTEAMTVVQRMRPMTAAQAHEPLRLTREEAHAAAQYVAEHLARRGWSALVRRPDPEETPAGTQ